MLKISKLPRLTNEDLGLKNSENVESRHQITLKEKVYCQNQSKKTWKVWINQKSYIKLERLTKNFF